MNYSHRKLKFVFGGEEELIECMQQDPLVCLWPAAEAESAREGKNELCTLTEVSQLSATCL